MKNSTHKLAFLSFLSILLFNCSSEKEIAKTLPQLSTNSATNITLTSASSGGNITADGGAAVTARGIVWNTATAPTISLATKTTDGSGIGDYPSTITNLTPSTNYYARAYAINSVGTGYGNEITFTTGAVVLPTLTTTAVSGITTNSAISGGTITNDGGGAVTARGVVWSTSQNPTITLTTKTSDGTGTGSYTSNLTNLTQNTTYYIRAYAINSSGTAYGNPISITTPQCNTDSVITDVDGNTYNTVVIGNQTWMKENLRTTKYNNGDVIPNLPNSSQWAAATTAAWAYYNNNSSYNNDYGKLYNGFTIDSNKNICPCGFHIPSDAEWNTLIDYLGGVNNAGIKLMSGSNHWDNIPSTVTNSSGFTALPGGYRYYGQNASFLGIRTNATFLSSSYGDMSLATSPDGNGGSEVYLYLPSPSQPGSASGGSIGSSIRCVKN